MTKTASDILRTKVPIEYSDEMFEFSKNLPPTVSERFSSLMAKLIPAIYYADRVDNTDWITPDEVPQPYVPLVLFYETGIRFATGYYAEEEYWESMHRTIAKPLYYKYIQPPIQ